jgi:catechol 2,3-dioxygenase-like lactoylglutathione lyase family enzyme
MIDRSMINFGGAGLPTVEWGEIFHVGVRVADLDAAQRELTGSLGVHWTSPARMPMKVWVPGQGYRQDELTISFTVEGPVHIELLHGSPGSYWDTSVGGAGLHHIGVWVADVARVNEELVRAGWVVELAGRPPDEGYGGFTYARSPGGLLFEPETCLGGSKERFERWYAGGSLL